MGTRGLPFSEHFEELLSINEVAMSRIVRGVLQVSETVCRHHSILNLIGGTKWDLNLNFFQGYT